MALNVLLFFKFYAVRIYMLVREDMWSLLIRPNIGYTGDISPYPCSGDLCKALIYNVIQDVLTLTYLDDELEVFKTASYAAQGIFQDVLCQ